MDTILSYLHSGVQAVLPLVILLGLLIFVHEMGHFLVAKLCGVRVETFSLGFGKKILKYKKGDTTYCLSLIPLGGYVKMFGDEIGAQIDEKDKAHSYAHKPVWQRIAVVIAGPLMNFVFAILIFFVVAKIGEETRSTVLGDVASSTQAYKDGFRSGDKILNINGQVTNSWEKVQQLLDQDHDQEITFDIERDYTHQKVSLKATPKLIPNQNILSLTSKVGDVEGFSALAKSPVVGVIGNSRAEKWGLKTGDKIISINGKSVTFFRQIENFMISSQGPSVPLAIERGTDKKIDKITLNANLKDFASLAGEGIESADLYLYKVIENSPAAKSGMLAGDRISSINAKPVSGWEDVLNSVKNYTGQGAMTFELQRGNQNLNLQMTPEMTSHMNGQGGEDKRFTVGIMPWIEVTPTPTVKIKYPSMADAFARGFDRSVEISEMTAMSFVRIIQNKISPKNIGGVISIGQAASETFKIGFAQFLQMMGFISINLFILNLLPIPVLDGGHLIFYLIESVKGGPVSLKTMEIANQIGVVMLLGVMVFALFNDFTRVLS